MAWHAKKSASGSKRWIKCPGSLALVGAMDPSLRRPTGVAAMTGTCAHALGEWCLTEGHREVPQSLMGLAVILDANEDATIDHDGRFGGAEDTWTRSQMSAALDGKEVKFFTRVDEKMLEGVQLYLDVVWEAKAEMGDTVEMSVETRLDLSWLRPDMGGTSDCTLYQFLGLLRAIDYKNGYIAVDAEDNTQGMYYLLGEAHRVDWMFDEAEVIIVQPNSKDGRKDKRFKITRAQLEDFRDMLAKASDLVDEATEALELCDDQQSFIEWASTYLDAGTADDHDHCTFCDAFATCPAAINKAMAIAGADFQDEVPDLNPVEVHDEEGLERLSGLIKWAGYLDKLVSAAKTLGQRRLEQGLPMPGQKLVHGKANRIYAATDTEIVAAMEEIGFTRDKVYEEPKPAKVKSPAQLEKLGKKAKERIAGVWDQDLNNGEGDWKMAPLAIKPNGKIAMAPETDPREAIIPGDAADDFLDDLPADYGDET